MQFAHVFVQYWYTARVQSDAVQPAVALTVAVLAAIFAVAANVCVCVLFAQVLWMRY
jgi:hypothetical protein